jgi:murein L,D-transpeptidase YafK
MLLVLKTSWQILLKRSKALFNKKLFITVGIILLALLLSLFFYMRKAEFKESLPSITYILVEKSRRKMSVYHDDQLVKEYRIALGSQPIGPKQKQGDRKTPEGLYNISAKNANSKFHLSLKISYPNEKDAQQALAKGVPGGDNIMIHGLGTGFGWLGKAHVLKDWTLGCVAVTNSEIEEIFSATPIGTPVEIRP